jgi:hypothetical protein
MLNCVAREGGGGAGGRSYRRLGKLLGTQETDRPRTMVMRSRCVNYLTSQCFLRR